MATTTRILTVATLAIAAFAGPAPAASAAAASGCGGVVFRDLDADGRRVETLEHDDRPDDIEAGVGGVRVVAVDADGATHATSTRNDGRWSIDLTPADFPIRIEFTVPDGHEAGRPGPDAGVPIQYVTSPDECDGRPLGNLGVFPVEEFCAARPEIAVACHVPADAAAHDEQPAIRAVSDGAVDDGAAAEYGDDDRTTIDDWLRPVTRTLATQGQIGTVYGQAARRDGTLFAAAFTKRHTRSTSELNPIGNPTVIYRLLPNGEPEVFVTLDPDAVDPHGAADRPRSADDLEVMDSVFTTGIGDIELSPDDATLFAVDLGRRELVTIDVESATVVERRRLDGSALGRSDCSVSATEPSGDLRPFGLGWIDDELLVGVVCSAATTVREDQMVRELGAPGPGAGDHDQLMGYVYGVGPDSFTELLAWPLATDRGETHSNGRLSNEAIWHPWTATFPFHAEPVAVSYPQPAITDLVVDARGNLVIALGDRWSHQTAPETDAPARDGSTRRITETVAAGDLQRACRRSQGWVIEGTPGCSGGFGNGWEFFDGESYGWQAETSLGSVARLPGRAEVVSTQMNPVTDDHAWSSGGLVWHATGNGDRANGVRLYDRQGSAPGSTFENASGLGDLAILCGGPDPSIGGSVWHDADADGVRDPGDGPVVGAAIELLDAAGEIVSVDYSDGQGRYSFDGSNVTGGLVAGAQYVLSMGERNYRPGRGVLVGVGDHTGLVATVPDVGSRDDLDSDARPEAGPDRTESRSFIDVRVGDDPATAGHESPIAHHYDFGLRDRYDLAVSTSPGPAMRNAGAAAFRIEISNEGSLPSGPIEVRADLPAATSLHPTRGASIAPTSIDAGSITWAFDDLASIAPGDVRVIDLELRVNDPSLTSITNSVQIVRDSGRDEDSDPGLTWGQDDEDELTIDLYGIDGTVWVDVASDETERVQSGAGGVVVVVLDADGARVGGTTTDEAGRFLFDSLPVGRYRIAIPASEFGSGRPLNGYDQAVGAGSANVTRALDRDGFVSSEPFELGGTTPPRSPTIDLGLVRRPPTPLVDIVVQMVLGPSALLCIAALVLQRRRHLGGALLPAHRV